MSDEHDYGRLLVLQHGDLVHLGALAPSLDGRAGRRPYDLARPDRERVPELTDDVRGVLILGGFQSAVAEHRAGFVEDELALVRAAVEREVPVLGICLGAQLAAAALGGEVVRREVPEIGLPPLVRTEAATGDEVFAGWPDGSRVVLAHEDEVTRLPDGARPMLAGSEGTPAWTAADGLVHAVQFHPEADAALVEGWLTTDGTRAMFATAGVDPVGYLDDVRRRERFLVGVGVSLVGRWLDGVVGADDPTPRRRPRG